MVKNCRAANHFSFFLSFFSLIFMDTQRNLHGRKMNLYGHTMAFARTHNLNNMDAQQNFHGETMEFT